MTRRPGPDLTERLRERILNLMHVWGLEPGDRLPGIRELAAETGVDHRAVARAYRSLEDEGLVEVRGRSGVYAARGVRRGPAPATETSAWIAEVLVEARRRRVSLPLLPEMIHQAVASRRLRCAFVESTEDQLAAYTWELTEGYGLDVTPLRADINDEESIRGQLAGMDFAVTTRFHERAIRRMAG
ncbi:MAG TPA: GntR family transcriptional regulator, partial [Chloroflexota bacterium]|nr:GntR family transcriptional regulator [Chloroflexota bacterium]